MTEAEIDKRLENAATGGQPLPPALLERIAVAVNATLRPVRPLPPTWLLAGGLLLGCAAVALLGAWRAGFQGVAGLSPLARGVIFVSLALLAWAAATGLVSEMIPGSRHRLTAGVRVALTAAVLLAVFTLLFRDYRTSQFLSAGLLCLGTGLLHALPAALLSYWVLRRGFAVNPPSAAAAAGTLAGLSGIALLELHCPNFQAPHVLVWHTAVLPAAAVVGAWLGWSLRDRYFARRAG